MSSPSEPWLTAKLSSSPVEQETVTRQSSSNKQEIYGFIYKITNNIDGKIYIGQTTNETIEERFDEHIACAIRLIKGEGKQADIKHSYLYNAMKFHGIKNFKIEEVDTAADLNELNELEIKYISEFNSLAPNGYNLKEGGAGGGKHSEITRETMRKMKAANINHVRHKDLADMPIHTGQSRNKITDELIAIRIVHHPASKKDKSYNIKKYGGLEKTKEIVRAEIERLDKLWEEKKKEIEEELLQRGKGLPVGVYATSHGYRVCKIIDGKKYAKSFERESQNDDKKRKDAIEWFNSLPPSEKSNINFDDLEGIDKLEALGITDEFEIAEILGIIDTYNPELERKVEELDEYLSLLDYSDNDDSEENKQFIFNIENKLFLK